MSETPSSEAGLFAPRKIAIQLVGFAVGVALLVWCIRGALAAGGWDRLRDASPMLVAAMLGCTIASSFLNGATFWITGRTMRPVRLLDLQWVNFASNMLNYAPVRLGAIARVAYHVRVDGFGLLQIGAWFAIISYFLVLGVGSCVLATLVHDAIDWIWLLLVVGQMALGTALTKVVAGNRLIARHGRGTDRILTDRGAVWVTAGLRLLDLAAYTGRMAVAASILDIELAGAHIVVLAVVAIAASLIPFGRLGFREFCVAITAQRLSLLATDVESNMQQLALVESAGEAIVYIPIGAACLLWYRQRWRSAGRGNGGEAD